ncbi:MAG: putative enzyme related to lactoylglutathione lyase [Rhodothermales bacterium]|jgi:predicted enzyme related to lactoylglutathione lyase
MGASKRKGTKNKSTTTDQPAKEAERSTPRHYVTWFEIPALDIDRATGFYNDIYGITMEVAHASEFVMALFPASEGIGGAVVVGPGCVPSSVGPLIYLNGGPDLDAVLSRVEGAGGRVVMPKTLISEETGFFALFIDTEGNRLALHSTS